MSRNLIVISDTEWDLDGLKDPNGNPANLDTILQRVKQTYDKILTVSLGRGDDTELQESKDFYLNRLATNEKTIIVNRQNIIQKLQKLKNELLNKK